MVATGGSPQLPGSIASLRLAWEKEEQDIRQRLVKLQEARREFQRAMSSLDSLARHLDAAGLPTARDHARFAYNDVVREFSTMDAEQRRMDNRLFELERRISQTSYDARRR